MKILIVHNYYLEPGGEDVAYNAEASLLEINGHDCKKLTESNKRVHLLKKYRLVIDAIWSKIWYKRIEENISHFQPAIAHFHNTFPLISPSVFYACNKNHVLVIQTLHNYRLICPSAMLLRDDTICEKCVNKKFAWPSIIYRCYHNSRTQTLAIALMLYLHKIVYTFCNKIDYFICLSEFSRNKFIQAGFRNDKLLIKPNFISNDPGQRQCNGDYFLFVGRLSREKGILLLIEAAHLLDCPIIVIGNGALERNLKKNNTMKKNIKIIGNVPHEEVYKYLKKARALVAPSICYENFPLVLIEAYSCGVPVIAARLGAHAEIVKDRKTGLLFDAGNAADLKVKMEWAWNHPTEMSLMGKAARREYEEKYTAEKNYQLLMEIYQKAIENHRLQL